MCDYFLMLEVHHYKLTLFRLLHESLNEYINRLFTCVCLKKCNKYEVAVLAMHGNAQLLFRPRLLCGFVHSDEQCLKILAKKMTTYV